MEPAPVEPLDRREAWDRLGRVDVGRLATSTGALPLVVPVHFALGGPDSIVFALPGDTSLARAVAGGVFAFEAGGHDEVADAWWSVLIRGVASPVEMAPDGPADFAHLRTGGPIAAVAGTTDIVHGARVRSALELPALAAYLTGAIQP